jgi:signal transduction histidine kinase
MTAAELEPTLPPPPRHPLTLARIETMVSRAIVGFGLVFGVLVIPTLLSQQGRLPQPLAGIEVAALCASLVWAVVAALGRRGIPAATGSFAVLYLLVLALWPLTAGASDVDGTSWLWMLCTVASAYATAGMKTWSAAVYAVLAPALFAFVLWQVGAGRWTVTLLDAVYAAIVGSVILTIATMLRGAAARVDEAQRAALAGYERGVREHLGEAERVEVDAIVHDSVLTTLLAAASARTPEARGLAVRMARDALGHLSATTPAPTPSHEGVTDADTLVAHIRRAATTLPHAVRVRTAGPTDAFVPAGAAEALLAATVQAMLNSSQHAGGPEVTRTVTISCPDPGAGGGVRIEIADDGVGFELHRVAPRRLGLTTSIIQRVEIVGGSAEVRSTPGLGTVITLHWPAPAEDTSADSAQSEART